ncbi:hypothetical protein TL16_g06606, partial [Triparma laevis f. inornata]
LAAVTQASSTEESTATGPIEYVIYLMMENRAFDHILGHLNTLNPDIDGCTPDKPGCSNPMDPNDPNSAEIPMTWNAVYEQSDPCHSTSCSTNQVFGFNDENEANNEPNMRGFLKSYSEVTSEEYAPSLMDSFHSSHVPALANLSMEYAVFDGYFASVPGPTMVNRAYCAAGTSSGMAENNWDRMLAGLKDKTMFTQLLDMGLDYKVYFQQIPMVLQHADMRGLNRRHKYRPYRSLLKDLETGDLPEFSFIEPAYYDYDKFPATDQHPDHDVSAGDALIKEVYEAVRASPKWEKTALFITYDEHGGFWDHVSPPTAPNPDNRNATDDPFDFSRLGIRVPMVVVSPWISKGTVIHSPAEGGQYEHSSIIKSVVHEMFKPKEGKPEQEYLTQRDSWSAGMGFLFNDLSSPRSDCPMTVPDVPSHREQYPNSLPKLDGKMPISDLQRELIQLAAVMCEEGRSEDDMANVRSLEFLGGMEERDGLEYVTKRLKECGIEA